MDNPGHYDEYPELTRADAERELAQGQMMTSPKAVNSAQTEREAFEANYVIEWNAALKENGWTGEYTVDDVKKLRNGNDYGEERAYLNGRWEGWQARALLADQSPAPASPSGEDAAEQSAAPQVGALIDTREFHQAAVQLVRDMLDLMPSFSMPGGVLARVNALLTAPAPVAEQADEAVVEVIIKHGFIVGGTNYEDSKLPDGKHLLYARAKEPK